MLFAHAQAQFWKLLQKMLESALVHLKRRILTLPRFVTLQDEKLLAILKNKINMWMYTWHAKKIQLLRQSKLKPQERLLLAFVQFNATFCTSAAFGYRWDRNH